VQGDGIFTLTKTETGVRAEKTLTNGLRLVKEFQPSTNYLVIASVRLENTSSQPVSVPAQEWTIGTATPMGPEDDGQSVGLMWYDGASKQEISPTWFDNTSLLGCLGMASKQPRLEYRAGTSNVFWASVHNQFFALVAMPKEPAQQIVSRPVELPRPSQDEIPPNRKNAPPPRGCRLHSLIPPSCLLQDRPSLGRFISLPGRRNIKRLAHREPVSEQRGSRNGFRRVLRLCVQGPVAGDELVA
jgi:hypothetical protein